MEVGGEYIVGIDGAAKVPAPSNSRQTRADSRGRALPPDSKVTGRDAHKHKTHTAKRESSESTLALDFVLLYCKSFVQTQPYTFVYDHNNVQ